MITVTYTKKQVTLRFLLSLLLFGLCIFLSWAVTREAVNILPDGNLYVSRASASIDFPLLSAAASKQGGLYVSGQASGAATVYSTVDTAKNEKVRLVFTDEFYPKLHRLQLASGTFFSTDTKLNTTDLVISTDLAFKLFGTLDALIGRPVVINGVRMTVVGVYTPDRSLLSELSSDGQDVVFAPYYSAAAETVPLAESIYVRAKSDVEKVDETAEAELNNSLNGQLSLFEKTQYYTEKTLLRQGFQLTLFFAGMLVILFIAIYLYHRIKKDVLSWRDALKRRETIRKTDILRRSMVFLLLALFAILLFRLISFELYLPFELTSKNILDPSFYTHYVIERVQLYHQSGYTYYGSYILCATLTQLVFGILALVFLLRALGWLRRVLVRK